MGIRDRWHRTLAGQLGHPHGLFGHLIGRGLNRQNRDRIIAAVDALGIQRGHAVADIGFGGGLGLELLLARVGTNGRVHGVDISAEMLNAARRRHQAPLSQGTLELQEGSMTALPLPDQSLDGAITVNTLYFIDDLDLAFAELARAIRPGGTVAIGIGDPEAMRQLPLVRHGFRVRPVEQVVAALEAGGLPLRDHRRVGNDPAAFHLLVAAPA